jgi:hypothetical protein
MNAELSNCIDDFEEARKDYEQAKNRLINLAIELGCNEKSINNNFLVARSYLEGMRKGLK